MVQASSAEVTELRGAGLRLMADVAGDAAGQTVILLHGGGQTRAAWRKVLPVLAARGYRAIAVDQRGHGDSERAPDGDYRLDRFADDLRAVAAELPSPPFLVGASIGGLASILALGTAPRLDARGLVLLDVVPRVEDRGADEIARFMRAAPDGFATLEDAGTAVSAYRPEKPPPANLEGLKRNLRQGGDGRWRWHWDPRFVDGPLSAAVRAHADRLEAAVATLRLPLLLVRGEKSRVVTVQAAERFHSLVPHAQLLDVAGADHMVAGDQNDSFNTVVLGFLDSTLRAVG